MRLYLEVARRSFRRHATYRGANAAGLFTNTVFGFIQAYVLVAVYRSRTSINGLDVDAAVTYAFLKQGFLMFIGGFATLDLTERIRTGDVVSDLYRPVDFQAWWLAQDTGRALFHAIARGIPPVIVGAFVFDLVVPHDVVRMVAFGVSAVLALVISFGMRFLVSLSAFWLLDDRGTNNLNLAFLQFFSGMLVPLNLFPTGFFRVVRLLPWAGVLHLPLEIYLGQRGMVGVLALQLFWAATLVLAGRAVMAAAMRRVVIQGG